MKITEAIAFLDEQVPDTSRGLPEKLFLYISRTTPLVNVDLLIKDDNGRTLLAWRNDQYAGRGWHVPGGIVRFKETLEDRLKKVAAAEIGAEVKFNPRPLALNQLIHHKHKNRSHFIAVLYKCFLPATFVPENQGLAPADAGYLKWHDRCPDNLIKVHGIYKKLI